MPVLNFEAVIYWSGPKMVSRDWQFLTDSVEKVGYGFYGKKYAPEI